MEPQLRVPEVLFADIERSLGRRLGSTSRPAIGHETLALFKWSATRLRRGLTLVAADSSRPYELITTPLLAAYLA